MKFFDLLAITRARVPVIKGKMMAYNPYTNDGSLAFDLCFLNDIAVVNSSLIREYSLYNTNVRYLMLAVKTFAKHYNIANAAEGTLSSYTWLNLVIYYCQCIGLVPVLQCPTLMTQHGIHRDVSNPWHCVNGLNTIYLTSDIVKSRNIWQGNVNNDNMNIGLLLYGFYNFYIHIFPKEVMTISIRVGATSATMLPKTAFHATAKLWRWAIEDPFETYDSHMPHDLGCHIKEDGMKRIIDAMRVAMHEYEQIMRGRDNDSDAATATAISRLVNSWLGPSKRLDTKMNDVVGSDSTTTTTGGSQQQQQQQRSTNDTRHHSQNNRAQGRGGNGGRGGGRGPSGNNLGQARPRYQGNKSQEQRRRDQQKAERHRNAQLHEAATREREEIESNIATGHRGGGRRVYMDGQEVGRGGAKSNNGTGRLPPQEGNALSDVDKARIKKERNDHKA
jgi:senataxin/terminal uridylyltransferase